MRFFYVGCGLFFVLVCVTLGWFWVVEPKALHQVQASDPVVYDVTQFATNKEGSTKPKQIIASLGATVADTGLDFYGRPAQMYRYHSLSEPPFYVLHSDGLLELVWYFAGASDDQGSKQQSLSYANKAFGAVYPLLGEQSKELFGQMLAGKQPKLPNNVLAASCQHYHCRIVLKVH